MSVRPSDRNAELARIHCLKRDLRLPDDEYRDLLFALTRARSAGDLDNAGRARLIEHLASLARREGVDRRPRAAQHGKRPSVAADREAQLRKLEALLADAGRPWAYVEAIAKRMCHVDAVRFCTAEQLGKLIAALEYDRRRRAAKAGA